MSLYCTHRGTFVGKGPRIDTSVEWKVELYKPFAADAAKPVTAEMVFPAEDPLVIEWEEWKPEQAVQGSMLTLKVISQSDREYIDYYTTKAGSVAIRVYRRGWEADAQWAQCWAGSLDPEFYEEPYETSHGYDVTMTFSDFGTLDRIDFRRFSDPSLQTTGNLVSVSGLIAKALELAHIEEQAEDFLRLNIPMQDFLVHGFDKRAYTFDDLSVDFSNFEDEEGEPKTWREVLEAVLMPLGLHITQRAAGRPVEYGDHIYTGEVLVYDTDSLYKHATDEGLMDDALVHWSSDSQTLSTAETYNNIKVTFSPYCRSKLIEDAIELDRQANELKSRIVLNAYRSKLPGAVPDDKWDYYEAFRILRSNDGTGVAYAWGDKPFFHMEPIYGSCPECDGLIFNAAPQYTGLVGSTQDVTAMRDLFRLKPVAVPTPMGDEKLVLSVSMLFDPRYNPFEPADTESKGWYNMKTEYEKFKSFCGWVMVPVRILLRDAEGNITHYYSNKDAFSVPRWGRMSYRSLNYGTWKPYDSTKKASLNGHCWLQWYTDKQEDPALDGWTVNKPTVGAWVNSPDFPKYFTHMPEGMPMAYPPHGGYIEIALLDGLVMLRRGYYYSGWIFTGTSVDYPKDDAGNLLPPLRAVHSDIDAIVQRCGWRAFRDINLSIGTLAPEFKECESDDLVTEGAVDANAREPLDLDTICGTARQPNAAMLGLYRTHAGVPIWAMEKAGVKNYMERILIGSLYSQYALRRTMLSGEAAETITRLPVLHDHNTKGLFIVASATLDAINGTEEITLVQFFPDNFTPELLYYGPGQLFEQQKDPPHDDLDYDLDTPWDVDPDDPGEDPDPGDRPDPWDDPWSDPNEDDGRYDDWNDSYPEYDV